MSDYIKANWKDTKSKIQERSYYPLPVRRAQIPKPNGAKRNLGIPTVMDRVIWQAMVQVLSPIRENYFLDYSFDFRPNRNCEMAITKVLEFMNEGYTYIVDIDLEKFFDNVPHDKLEPPIAERNDVVAREGYLFSLTRLRLEIHLLFRFIQIYIQTLLMSAL